MKMKNKKSISGLLKKFILSITCTKKYTELANFASEKQTEFLDTTSPFHKFKVGKNGELPDIF